MRKINTENSIPDLALLRRQIDFLSELALEERVERLRTVLAGRTDYLVVGLENMFYAHNASAVLRSCEAFGIQQVHVIEELCPFKPSADIVRGTDQWLDIHRYNGKQVTRRLVERLKGEGYRIVSTSPHIDGSTPDTFDLSKGKAAIFFGTEKQGISRELRELSDEFIQVPMYGFVESLNVSVCAAIVLQTLSARLHGSDLPWGLGEERREELMLKWLKRSVRDAERILLKRFK